MPVKKKAKKKATNGMRVRAGIYASSRHCGYDEAREWDVAQRAWMAGYRAAQADMKRKAVSS